MLAKLAESRIHKAITLTNAVAFFLRLTKAGEALSSSVIRHVAAYILKNGSKTAEFQSLTKCYSYLSNSCFIAISFYCSLPHTHLL